MTGFVEQYIGSLAGFISHHELIGAVVVFLLAFSESIPVLGIVMPGTSIIVALAVLAGLGILPLWLVVSAAIIGAIAGDGLSFWYGHRHKAQALEIWPISAHPAMIARSEAFFERHGGKSITIARFTPVVRAFVPLIAGVSGMKPARFYAANILSAFAWAFSHILPAAAAGASLGVLHAISGRLTAVMLAMIILALVVVVVLRSALRWGSVGILKIRDTAHQHLQGRSGTPARILRQLTDPDDGSLRELTFMTSIIAMTVFALLVLARDVVAQDQLTRADQAISALVSSWRTHVGDGIMVFVTALGDTLVTSLVAAVAVLWAFLTGNRRVALGILISMAAALVFVIGLKSSMHVTRPIDIYAGVDSFSFPSGHTTFAATLYGILAYIAWRAYTAPVRSVVLGFLACLIVAIAFSRVYLQAHWPSDVAAGLLFGIGASVSFAIFYRDTRFSQMPTGSLFASVLLALLTVGSWHASVTHAHAMALFEKHSSRRELSRATWLQGAWRSMPAHRVDLGGEREEPILVQWAGSLASLAAAVEKQGWVPATELTRASVLNFLIPRTPLDQVPVLPRLNSGKAPIASFVQGQAHGNRRLVLHVWRSGLALAGNPAEPILLLAVVEEKVEKPLGLLQLPLDVDTPAVSDRSFDFADLPHAIRKEPAGQPARSLILAYP